MTICIAADGFPPKAGGIVTFNWHLTKLLLAAGHSVVQLNVDRTPNTADRVQTNGSFTQVWLAKSFLTHKKKWAAFFRPGGMDAPDWIATGLAMGEWLLANSKAYRIDLIEASDFGGYGAFLSTPELPPLILTGHASILQLSRANFYHQKEDSYQFLRRLEKLAYENAAAIITHSERNADDIRAITSRPVFETKMPWTSIELETENSPVTPLQIVGVGALQPAKGIFVLMKALQRLKHKGVSLQVTWFGDDTYHSPEIYSVVQYLQMNYPDVFGNEFIWRKGEPHQAILSYLKNAEAVLLPSLFETFGYTVLEAAFYGKAVIVSENVGAGQHFVDGQSILVVPANNAVALSEALEKLVTNDGFRKKLGEAAKNAVKVQFNPSSIIEQRMNTYQEVLADASYRQNGFAAAMDFTFRYCTLKRKIYYAVRAMAKTILKPHQRNKSM